MDWNCTIPGNFPKIFQILLGFLTDMTYELWEMRIEGIGVHFDSSNLVTKSCHFKNYLIGKRKRNIWNHEKDSENFELVKFDFFFRWNLPLFPFQQNGVKMAGSEFERVRLLLKNCF